MFEILIQISDFFLNIKASGEIQGIKVVLINPGPARTLRTCRDCCWIQLGYKAIFIDSSEDGGGKKIETVHFVCYSVEIFLCQED